ncbi:MAG: phosphopyruvate hydratase [Patescibacteria group bacterium]
MSKIKNIFAREISDSRENPAVEVELETEKGFFKASVPSGASTGKNEALELRDEDGKGVSFAIKNVNEIIAKELKGKNPEYQKELDEIMIRLDGTENKSKLGANAILPVSMAIYRAGAASQKLPLYEYIAQMCEVGPRTLLRIPLASFNFIEGGAHALGRNNLDLQEFMAVPQEESFKANLIIANKIFENLKKIISESYGSDVAIGDEGGFAPKISKSEQALFLLKSAIARQENVGIAVDAAASQFFRGGKYIIEGKESTRSDLVDFYRDLVERFPIISIEDPFDQEDWEGFKEIKRALPNIIIVADDLTTTNIKRIKEAHSKNACNGVILKINQIGTVSETIEAGKLAKEYGWKTIVSHRSGETMDTFIADLAVGLGADFIKSGSPSQPERMAKYSRLLEIENELLKK